MKKLIILPFLLFSLSSLSQQNISLLFTDTIPKSDIQLQIDSINLQLDYMRMNSAKMHEQFIFGFATFCFSGILTTGGIYIDNKYVTGVGVAGMTFSGVIMIDSFKYIKRNSQKPRFD